VGLGVISAETETRARSCDAEGAFVLRTPQRYSSGGGPFRPASKGFLPTFLETPLHWRNFHLTARCWHCQQDLFLDYPST